MTTALDPARRAALLARFERVATIAPRVVATERPSLPGRAALWGRRVAHFRGKYLRHVAARLGLGADRPAVAELFWGRRVALPRVDFDARFLHWLGLLPLPEEVRLTRFFLRHLRPDDVFYDVGANYGFYTWLAEELGAEVHAFEPAPHLFACLERNRRAGPAVTLNRLALADRAGAVTFFAQAAGHSGGSTLVADVAAGDPAFRVTTVEATTLDDYVATRATPTVLKLDVEGAETLILAGARRLLERASPLIALEVWPGELGRRYSHPAIGGLQTQGYAAFRIRDDGSAEAADGVFESAAADNLILARTPPGPVLAAVQR